MEVPRVAPGVASCHAEQRRAVEGETRLVRDAQPVLAVDELLRWVERAAAVLAGRWRSAILWLLVAHPRRYNELVRELPGISPKVLTHQLRELEREGILTREAQRAGPKHVVYTLTPLGAQLGPVLAALECWARDHHAWRAGTGGRSLEVETTVPHVSSAAAVGSRPRPSTLRPGDAASSATQPARRAQ